MGAPIEPRLDPVSEAAVDWLVQFHSGAMTEADQARHRAWLAAHPQHQATWQRLSGSLHAQFGAARALVSPQDAAPPMGDVMGQALAHAQRRGSSRRRMLSGALALGGVSAGALLLADRQTPWRHITADLRTSTGERHAFSLPDGSELLLDARSAVDLDFSEGRRQVKLRQGALLVQARPASDGLAPFEVLSRHGRTQALGTRFSVRLEATYTRVGMLEHATRLTTEAGASQVLEEGHSARFDSMSIETDDRNPQAEAAWQRGMLEVHNQPLGEVVQALRAYRRGFIRISPQAAALRVYGNYALDDSDRAFDALAATLPITVRVYQRGWLVVIEAA
ncbi:FecR domain-containing protein [Comamonas sp. JUb58]|uniref:FecR domain-containing protein n=1 Tax=Comamonas sp. JUb58 TaxID=2485114 RepID=UPI0010EDB636|nr:FecR domain-containing protein [Comamonas sp. JUb58]TDS82198.1 FecR family protein [Comamonas sp. JUb58]